jgi:hypothetical protein
VKLSKFQQESYKFHLQHHENIKQLISGLNRLNECLDKFGVNTTKINVVEDADLMTTDVDEIEQMGTRPSMWSIINLYC